jgi:hypothetical protein
VVRDGIAIERRFVVVVGALGEGVAKDAQEEMLGVIVNFRH